jgi:hypothetical protein
MRKFIVLFVLVAMLSSVVAFADTSSGVSIIEENSTRSYVDEVIDYTMETYSYDQWGNPVRVDSQTFYKTIQFPNGYELTGTTEEVETLLLGYVVYTYYNYRTY